MKLSPTVTSAVIGAVSLFFGFFLKAGIDYFVKRRTDKRQLSDKITLEQVNTLLNYLSKLIEACKIQVQDEQYAFNESYWKSKHQTNEQIQKSKDDVAERSKQIIKYKEICTRSSYFLPDKGGEVRIKLNDVVHITDVDIINFYRNHVEASEGADKYINDLNLLREQMLIVIRDSLS